MNNHRMVIKFLWMVPLIFSTLACNAVTQLINSGATVDISSTNSATQTDLDVLPPPTLTAADQAACSARLPQILSAASSDETFSSSLITVNGEQEVRYLVVYSLNQDNLGAREDLLVPGDLENDLDSRASHEYIWNYFAALIPPEERSFVTEFSILSDGSNNILAGVSPTYANPSEWTLKVDVVDARDPYSLTYTLLHEFGHFLTLKPSQVPPDNQVFYNPEDQAVYEQTVAACSTYFTGEGCSNSGSYIHEFYNKYWSSFDAEWQEAQKAGDEEVHDQQLDNFYSAHKDQFLTRYAASSPEEDIAESWTFFILSPRPEPTSVANEKILFFYQFPELMALREQILNRLCMSFPQQ